MRSATGLPLIILYLLLSVIAATIISGCSETEVPENPYDAIQDDTGNDPAEPDPRTITGLHKKIFSPRCALSGCHDGTFEPDFRTVQSSYASLVYQPVIKNTVNNTDTFFLCVIPFDHINSFLYERITTPTSEYMPSNGMRLSATEISYIKDWINDGARDAAGNIPAKPDLLPNILGYAAFDLTLTMRYDTVRLDNNPLNSFIVPAATSFNIIYVATDSLDGPSATPVSAFTNCRIMCSLDKNDFSSAITVNSGLISVFWYSTLNTSLWSPGTTVYFRIYVNDGQHSQDAEFPRDESMDYYKTLYSFYVQ